MHQSRLDYAAALAKDLESDGQPASASIVRGLLEERAAGLAALRMCREAAVI